MLRRVLSLTLCLLVVLSFAACSKKGKAEKPVTTGFSCDVEASYDDMNVKGRLTRSSAGTLTFEVTEPESLKGLSMQLNGDSISIKLFGLSFDVKPENIPQTALGKSMLSALDSALDAKDQGEITEEGLVTKGSTPAGDFEIVSDPKTGNLLKLRIPSANLAATFSNFSTSSSLPAGNNESS
ncbi:MAG TPA: hypothetical protein GXX54_02160 [Clostridiales bacterium]|nr:hypothetical protein [Clostridiales bacterium]